MQEIGIREVLEQIDSRLNHLETRLTNIELGKAEKWEVRIWFMTILALLGSILGTIIAKL